MSRNCRCRRVFQNQPRSHQCLTGCIVDDSTSSIRWTICGMSRTMRSNSLHKWSSTDTDRSRGSLRDHVVPMQSCNREPTLLSVLCILCDLVLSPCTHGPLGESDANKGIDYVRISVKHLRGHAESNMFVCPVGPSAWPIRAQCQSRP